MQNPRRRVVREFRALILMHDFFERAHGFGDEFVLVMDEEKIPVPGGVAV